MLDKVGHLWILGKIFTRVIIPPAVNMEWLRPGGHIVPDWLSIEKTLSAETSPMVNDLYQKLDKGEAEAIALFSFLKADLLLLDDLNGRRLAKAMQYPVVGTLGILVAAKRKGLIPALSPLLVELKKHRFYITDEVIKKSLALANEA